MTTPSLVQQRMLNQHLARTDFTEPADVVRWLGAVQAQDYPGAKWGIAQRMTGATDAGLDAAFDQGEILRTPLLRPTWHVAAPEDIRWLLVVTAPRVQALNAYQYRQLELDGQTLFLALHHIESLLGDGKAHTRRDVGTELERQGMPADGQRLAYIVMHAELEGVICSGPMQGKQHTYALLNERVPPAPELSLDEALAELAVRFFRSHGPARPRDLAWWSSLTLAESRRAIDLAGDRLDCAAVDGESWCSGPSAGIAGVPAPLVRLLPNYDEYVSGDGILTGATEPDPDRMRDLIAAGRLDRHFLVIDGRLRGGWRRSLGAKSATVTIDAWDTLTPAEQAGVEVEVNRYAAFLNKAVELAWER